MWAADCGGSLNAVGVSPDGRTAVVGGRDVLKTVSLAPPAPDGGGGFREGRNLRASRKKGLDLATNDVKWHPLHEHIVASGSTSGAVLLWDVARPKGAAPGSERNAFKHSRTVNRVTWHPLHEAWLLTGSQDGTCRLWDARCSPGAAGGGALFPTGAASATARAVAHSGGVAPAPLLAALGAFDVPPAGLVVPSGADSVRDVAFDPFRPLTFACALEDGGVSVYDVRRAGSAYALGGGGGGGLGGFGGFSGGGGGGGGGGGAGGPLLRFTAHVGVVVSLAWHPTQPGMFVTGGRDRLIKVWSLAGHSDGAEDGVVLRALAPRSTDGGGAPVLQGGARSPHLAPAAVAGGSGALPAGGLPAPSPLLGGGRLDPLGSPLVTPLSRHPPLLRGATASTADGGVRQLVAIQSIASVSRLAWRAGPAAEVSNREGGLDAEGGRAAAAAGCDTHRSAFAPDADAGGGNDDDDDAGGDDDDAGGECIAPARGGGEGDAVFHLATAAALLDTYVTVWDVRRPFLPVAQFAGHSDVATGLAWIPPPVGADGGGGDAPASPGGADSWLLSAGKDGRLIAHPPASAIRPHAALATSGFAISATHVAWCHQPIDRRSFWRTEGEGGGGGGEAGGGGSTPQHAIVIVPAAAAGAGAEGDAGGDPLRPNALRAVVERHLAPLFRGMQLSPPPQVARGVLDAAHTALAALPALVAPAFDPPPAAFAALATRYVAEGAPSHVLCAHNAGVAESLGLQLLAQTWRVLGALWAPLPTPPQPPLPPRVAPGGGAHGAAAGGGGGEGTASSHGRAGKEGAVAPGGPDAPPVRGGGAGAADTPGAAVGSDGAPPPAPAAQLGADAPEPAPAAPGRLALPTLPPPTGSAPDGAPPPGYIPGLLEALAAADPEGAGSDAFATTDDESESAYGRDDAASAAAAGSQPAPRGGGVGGAGASAATPARPTPGAAPRAPFPTAQKGVPPGARPAAVAGGDAAATAKGAAPAAGAAAGAAAPAPPAPPPAAGAPGRPPPTTLAEYEAASWHAARCAIARDVLEWHAELGDVQTCVTAARVLGRGVEDAVGRRRLQSWLVAYIDLLHRRRLWAPASTVMARANDEGIRRLNQLHTAVAAACGRCGRDVAPRAWDDDGGGGGGGHGGGRAPHPRGAAQHPDPDCCAPPSGPGFVVTGPGGTGVAAPLASDSEGAGEGGAGGGSGVAVGAMQALAPPRCGGCASPVTTCALCLLPVRGAYAWCQGCGHGGHLAHMAAWFHGGEGGATLCPTGCGHTCSLEVAGGGGGMGGGAA